MRAFPVLMAFWFLIFAFLLFRAFSDPSELEYYENLGNECPLIELNEFLVSKREIQTSCDLDCQIGLCWRSNGKENRTINGTSYTLEHSETSNCLMAPTLGNLKFLARYGNPKTDSCNIPYVGYFPCVREMSYPQCDDSPVKNEWEKFANIDYVYILEGLYLKPRFFKYPFGMNLISSDGIFYSRAVILETLLGSSDYTAVQWDLCYSTADPLKCAMMSDEFFFSRNASTSQIYPSILGFGTSTEIRTVHYACGDPVPGRVSTRYSYSRTVSFDRGARVSSIPVEFQSFHTGEVDFHRMKYSLPNQSLSYTFDDYLLGRTFKWNSGNSLGSWKKTVKCCKRINESSSEWVMPVIYDTLLNFTAYRRCLFQNGTYIEERFGSLPDNRSLPLVIVRQNCTVIFNQTIVVHNNKTETFCLIQTDKRNSSVCKIRTNCKVQNYTNVIEKVVSEKCSCIKSKSPAENPFQFSLGPILFLFSLVTGYWYFTFLAIPQTLILMLICGCRKGLVSSWKRVIFLSVLFLMALMIASIFKESTIAEISFEDCSAKLLAKSNSARPDLYRVDSSECIQNYEKCNKYRLDFFQAFLIDISDKSCQRSTFVFLWLMNPVSLALYVEIVALLMRVFFSKFTQPVETENSNSTNDDKEKSLHVETFKDEALST